MKHTIRTPHSTKEVDLNPPLAIRAFCEECLGWRGSEIKDETQKSGYRKINPDDCTSPLCPLFCFKGKTGIWKRAQKLTEEQRENRRAIGRQMGRRSSEALS